MLDQYGKLGVLVAKPKPSVLPCGYLGEGCESALGAPCRCRGSGFFATACQDSKYTLRYRTLILAEALRLGPALARLPVHLVQKGAVVFWV